VVGAAEVGAALVVQEEAARAVARADELTEDAVADAAVREEMGSDRCHWDEDMAAA
jgi:hypothetical protein